MKTMTYSAWMLIIVGMVFAVINGKFFNAYSNPPKGSAALYVFTFVLLLAGLIMLFQNWRRKN